MCLITTFKTAKIAKQDIVCYKVCRETKEDDIVFTPYQYTEIRLGNMNTDTKDVFIAPTRATSYKNRCFVITTGVYHSFKKLKDAKIELSEWNKVLGDTYCIVRCIIPRGSEYFSGKFWNRRYYESYGSKQIKLIEKIK